MRDRIYGKTERSLTAVYDWSNVGYVVCVHSLPIKTCFLLAENASVL